jgi:hypothetical protein
MQVTNIASVGCAIGCTQLWLLHTKGVDGIYHLLVTLHKLITDWFTCAFMHEDQYIEG